MGLDMYLVANRHVGGWNFDPEEERALFESLTAALGAEGLVTAESPSMHVSVNVAYWRKANAVHNWFVQNCQGGEDDCREARVSREQLEELLSICRRVLGGLELEDGDVYVGTRSDESGTHAQYEPGVVASNTEFADELLPTKGGFFFGGTDYDSGYVQDLKDTIDQVGRALEAPECWSFAYRSSW